MLLSVGAYQFHRLQSCLFQYRYLMTAHRPLVDRNHNRKQNTLQHCQEKIP